MPDAGAGRKRQIQVTPGPFKEAAAHWRARYANSHLAAPV